MIWSMHGSGNGSWGQALLRLVKSTHIRSFPPFLGTTMGFASHSGYRTSRMTPAASSLRVSWTMKACFFVDYRLAFCFTGRMLGHTFRWCSFTSLGTPTS